MKIKRFKSYGYFIILLSPLLFIFSCKKKHEIPTNSFTWTYSGQNYKANIDSAYLFGTPIYEHIIIARTGTNLTSPSTGPLMVMSSVSTGSHNIPYSIESGTSALIYTDDLGNTLQANSGSINITDNTGRYLSGNFSVTLDDGELLTSTFLNVPIRE